MKTIRRYLMLLTLLSAGGFFLGGCGSGDTGDTASEAKPPLTGLIVHNRSQFEIEHLFVYDPTTTYLQSESLIDANLDVGEMILHRLEAGQYLVTVSRRQNIDGDLLAYTTTEPVVLDSPKVLEYYDTEFRVYELRLTIPAVTPQTESTGPRPQRAYENFPFVSIPFAVTWMQ